MVDALSVVIAVLGVAVIIAGSLLGGFSFTTQSFVVFIGIVLLGAGFEVYQRRNHI